MQITPIQTERLTIRAYEVWDAPLLKDAIDTSIEYLKPRLERVKQEPETLQEKELRIVRFKNEFEEGKDWRYGLFSKDNTIQIWSVGLHQRIWEWGIEIWYWIRESHWGKWYITEAVRVLIPIAFELWFDYIEIHTRLDNIRSARIPEKLNFTQNGKISKKTWERNVWVLKKDEYKQ